MNNEETINYVRRMIVTNLNYNNCLKEAISVQLDTSNELLLAHIKGVIELLKKAEKILEAKNESRQSD